MALYDRPMDPRLAELVRAAVHACNRHVIELEGANRYIGHYSMGFPLSVRASEHGWPSVSTAFISEGPTDFQSPFGLNAGSGTKLAYDDVPELSAAIDYMLADPAIVDRLNDGTGGRVNRYTKISAALLVTSVLDRVRHTSVENVSDEDIERVYLEVEPTLALERLPVDIVVPLVLTSFDIDSAEISQGVCIERMSDELNRARHLEVLRHHDVNPMVANAATHAIVLVGWEMQWPDAWYHEVDRWPIDTIDRVLGSIELASPDVVPGYAQVLIQPRGWAERWRADLPPLLAGPTLVKYPPSFTRGGWNTPGTHFESDRLDDLGLILQRLDGSSKPVSIALSRLRSARLRQAVDDQVIDLCIGLEALCGDRGEVTYKLKMRVAALLAMTGLMDGLTTTELMSAVSQVYRLRSRLVHGDDAGKYGAVKLEDGSSLNSLELLHRLVRLCILATLYRPDLADPKALDEAMIEAVQLTRD
jgi:hypothetical protein